MSAKAASTRIGWFATLTLLVGTACATLSTSPSEATAPTATVAAATSTSSQTDSSEGVASSARATAASATIPSSAATTLVVDADNSHASYHAHEQLVGRNLPSEAVGTSSSVSGSIVLDRDGSIAADQSQIQVDLRKLKSDESRRDNFIQGNTLQTSRFPMATFVPRQAEGLPSPLPTDGQLTFQLDGDLTVHGVTKPVSWQVNAQFDGASVNGDATTDVNISDFGMTPPKAGPVLSIQDGLTLELAFSAARQA
ncbi:MAG: YceI family protein [Chloroflexi bacterium]|nr:YceI family protein [Chloroflexota bacterium]